MPVQIPRSPHDGRPRHCFKCKSSFVPCRDFPNARICPGCRANPTKEYAHRADPRAKPKHGHTHAWDSRSLAIVEAAFLRMAWGRAKQTFVTGDSE